MVFIKQKNMVHIYYVNLYKILTNKTIPQIINQYKKPIFYIPLTILIPFFYLFAENISTQQYSTTPQKIKYLKSPQYLKIHPRNNIINITIKQFDNIWEIYLCVSNSLEKRLIKINKIDIFAYKTSSREKPIMNQIIDLDNQNYQIANTDQQNHQLAQRSSNLCMNLNNAHSDDVFEIGDENQQINFGQSSMHLQFRQIFTSLRVQIEKLFNQQQISYGISKLLPQALQDDYYELMSYIKQKLNEYKIRNQISFVMAEPGNEPDLQNSLYLPQLQIDYNLKQSCQNLNRLLQQKQLLIHSLMNERTSQQNTINQLEIQKQEIQQQNQKRFMSQCNVYKTQLKQYQQINDILEMNIQSMKNIIRNILEAFFTDQDMEDDFLESMKLYERIAKLNEKQIGRIKFYTRRFLEIKGLMQDQ